MRALITGATGNIGALVTKRLLQRGERPCVFVRNAKKARELFGDRVDVRVGDLTGSRRSLATSFAGIDRLFLVNSGPDLAAQDRAAAFAAKAAGVQHLVKLSTLDVGTGVGTGAWHARGEAAVKESGIAFTFIQSAAFMSNALGWASSIRAESVLASSTGDGKIAFIHPDDIAEVCVRALTTGDQHLGSSLVITGREALSYGEMANKLGAAVGREVRFAPITDEDARRGALAWAEKRYADALVDIWRAIREGRLATVTDGVQRIICRPPISFDRWADENAAAFR